MESAKAVAELRLARTQLESFAANSSLQVKPLQRILSWQRPRQLDYIAVCCGLRSSFLHSTFPTVVNMAGGKIYRHLGRKSSHRKALLRNLVTSLIENESITTTWAKAKEAQRLADTLITLGKKNTEASRRKALSIFFVSDPLNSFGYSIALC